MEGTYYYRPTTAPPGARFHDVREALLRITSIWHTHRSTQSTPDDSPFRWSPAQYMQQMAQLTWTRVCSGSCESSHISHCIPVPKCSASGDYAMFQVFFRPNLLSFRNEIISGMDLHESMTKLNVVSSCNSEAPSVTNAMPMFLFGSSNTSPHFGLITKLIQSNIGNKDWGQPIDPVHVMSRPGYIANRKSRLEFALKHYNPQSWGSIAEHLGMADRNRRIDLYRMSQPFRDIDDDAVASRLHLDKWWFNEWSMSPFPLSKKMRQKVILLTSHQHLKRYEILCNILSKATHLYIEIHELADYDAKKLGLDGLCRPDDIHWKGIDDRCTAASQPTFDWSSVCKTSCAGQVIYIRYGTLERMKDILYHEMAHLFHDMLWKPYGNHDQAFHDRHRQVMQLVNSVNM